MVACDKDFRAPKPDNLIEQQKIEDILNNMPRKILGYKTPKQVWNEG